MSIEGALFTILSAAATNAGSRIYPKRLPVNAVMPAITYTLISKAPTYTRDGDDSQDALDYQLDLHGDTSESVRLLELQVRSAVSFYAGTADGATIGRVLITNEQDDFETGTDLDRRIVDLRIWHNNA